MGANYGNDVFGDRVAKFASDHNTTNKFLRATFTSFCDKHVLAHVTLFKNFSVASGPIRLAGR